MNQISVLESSWKGTSGDAMVAKLSELRRELSSVMAALTTVHASMATEAENVNSILARQAAVKAADEEANIDHE